MNRKWTLAAWLVVGMVVVVGTGCKKKAPAMPEEPMEPVAPATEPAEEIVEPPVKPAPETPGILDMELIEAQEYAVNNGLLGDVYFDFDKYDLKPEARERLAKNAEFMRKYPQFQITVEGHCDERGTNEYNLALGDRRANAAAGYVGSLGVPVQSLRTVSFGEEKPGCRPQGPGCWDRNRRAHFVISGRN